IRMRSQRVLIFGLAAALCSSSALGQTGGTKGVPSGKSENAAAPLRFVINPHSSPYFATIDSIDREGRVRIKPPDDVPPVPVEFRPEVVEGYYLGVVQKEFGLSLAGARLVRVQVLDVGARGVVQLQVGKPAALELKAGEFLMMFRPVACTTAQLKQ